MRVSGWANSKKVHTSKANASSEVVWSIFPRYPLEQFVYVCIILFCSIPYYLRISSMICSIPRNWPWICHPLVQKCFLPNVENVEGSPPRFYLFWQLTKKLDQTDIMTIAYTAYQNITISLDLKMFTRHQNVSTFLCLADAGQEEPFTCDDGTWIHYQYPSKHNVYEHSPIYPTRKMPALRALPRQWRGFCKQNRLAYNWGSLRLKWQLFRC